MKHKNLIIVVILTALIAGSGGFFGGTLYQKSKRVTFTGRGNGLMMFGQNQGQGQNRNRMGGIQPVMGEITAVDTTSLTVKTPDGSSKIVLFSDSTKINQSSQSDKTALKVGETITAFGASSATGAITAQNISIGGVGPMMGVPKPEVSGAPPAANL